MWCVCPSKEGVAAAKCQAVDDFDRKKDIMINAAGKNLAPAHIENVIKASPYIKEVVAVADPSPHAVQRR